MKNKQQQSKPYTIPSRFNVKFSKFWIGLIIFLDIDAIFVIYLSRKIEGPPLFLLDKEFTLIVLVFFAALVLLNFYYIFRPIFKKEFVELTENSIRYRSFFRDRSIKYVDIDSMEVIYIYRKGNALKIYSTVEGILQKPLIIPHEFKFINIREADLIHTLDKMRLYYKLNLDE